MFGDELKKWRKLRKFTQAELGKKVGVSGAYIQQLELGKKTNPSLEVVMNLCSTLEIAPFDLDYGFSNDDICTYFDSRSKYIKEIDKKVELNKNATQEKNGDTLTIYNSKEYIDNHRNLEELSKKYFHSLIEHETSKVEHEEDFFALVLSWLPWDDLDSLPQEQVNEIVNALTLMYKYKLYEFKQANQIEQ
ncbi:DNA-binding helix-turn-helix protein [Clostridiales bacterium oral taxon 876 str. F0540]|nr:DNA-binding helix-turn-helix protein [Clostridiales bacterium oral taxon 876 str. F0540]